MFCRMESTKDFGKDDNREIALIGGVIVNLFSRCSFKKMDNFSLSWRLFKMLKIETVNAESISSWDSLFKELDISFLVKLTPSVIDISSERRFSIDWSVKVKILKY